MNFESGTAYAASDADDEYERSVHDSSPVAATDSETSPTDSEGPSSNDHTPTTYGHERSGDRLPETIISEWTPEECADFVSTIGLPQYAAKFTANEIDGEALVALQHEDLKGMGITSVGHRLTILKSVYDVKKAQDVPIESDHYVPLSADAEAQYATATLKDIKHLVEQLRLRDERMSLVEQDLRRLADDYRRLREDVLPALRLAKEQQPLPPTNNGQASYGGYDPMAVSPAMPTPSSQSVSGSSSMPKRQASTKKIVLGGPGGLLKSQASSSSPTHLQTTHDRSFLVEQTLDPSSAAERAVLSSQHLAAMNGSNGTQQNATSPGYPPNMPSPTSPPTGSGLNTSGSSSATLNSRFYRSDQPTPSSRTTFSESDNGYTVRGGGGVGTSSVSGSGGGGSTVGGSGGAGDKPQQQPPRRNQTPAPDTPSSNASVEIFKSFRVSMDDPCYKVLPAALRKYQINAPWDQYALYIVYGDQERCLGLDEKPLILFKQLDKEGKKPMFMLRKTNNAQVDLSGDAPGSAGLSTAAARGAATGYDPPGGII